MYAMRYEITLPADYDMGIIHERVRTRGPALDDFPGLGLTAYCVRERGDRGSPVNQYAPFYLWADTAGMNRFLWGGGGFAGIEADFGRPVVRHWTGAGWWRGVAVGTAPASATIRTERVPHGVDAARPVSEALREAEDRAQRPGVHSTALAVDPHHWELVHLTLWRGEPDPHDGDAYRVPYLSAPGLDKLPHGRAW